MTEKDLAKLRRPDLLALLVAQGKEAGALQEQLDATNERLKQALELDKRLRAKLDEKDQQIEHLKERLDDKDKNMSRLKLRLEEKDTRINMLYARVEELTMGNFQGMDTATSLVDIAFKLDLMLRAAQKATDNYLNKKQDPSRWNGGVKEGYRQDP